MTKFNSKSAEPGAESLQESFITIFNWLLQRLVYNEIIDTN